jgi:hypothetical protein
MKKKTVELAAWWHDDGTIERRYKAGSPAFVFNTGGRLKQFRGSHPAIMSERIRAATGRRAATVHGGPAGLRHRLLDWLEERLDWRPGKYRNYTLLRKGAPSRRGADAEGRDSR